MEFFFAVQSRSSSRCLLSFVRAFGPIHSGVDRTYHGRDVPFWFVTALMNFQ